MKDPETGRCSDCGQEYLSDYDNTYFAGDSDKGPRIQVKNGTPRFHR